ncbi:glycine cleavage system aminomethyltransferase GcvT [Alteraurantiacibacter palmitatis]|uniref:aminomethyltransferase n=1 Tax=Alteraurantiacibacter palmitatis TaxID=2054628 RepID=A0ABV7E0P4_9SPHN
MTQTEPLTLPLDAWHRKHGARMVPFAGFAMPLQFAGILAEHEWTRTSASLFDVSHMGQISASGAGAIPLLESLLPTAVANLAPGRIRYALLLNEAGGIIDDLMLTRRAEDFLLIVNGATRLSDLAYMQGVAAPDAAVTLAEDQALLALQGPLAAKVLDALVPGIAALSFMTAAAFAWEGARLWISRSGYSGEDGFEISLPAAAATAFADALIADERCRPAGLGARDSLRLEAGLPLYGHDLDENTDPLSAGLGFALSPARMAAGGFNGHAALARLAAAGPTNLRVGLALEGRLPAREGAVVMHDGHEVGRVTSGGFSPSLSHPIALAFVPPALAKEGTSLTVQVRGKDLPARITPLPFVPHRYVRKGSV